MELDIATKITKEKVSNRVDNFIEDLKKVIQKRSNTKESLEISKKYKEYWNECSNMHYEACAILGLSKLYSDKLYYYNSTNYIENEISKLSEKGSIIYRKQGTSFSNEKGEAVFLVDKFENGKMEHINIVMLKNQIPDRFDNEDIIFQYDEKNNIIIRNDLKKEIIAGACKSMEQEKIQYRKEVESFKKEGHLYEAYEGEGYIHLRDMTEDSGAIEDIDFVVDNYKGEGIYKFINGKYVELDFENRYSTYWKEKNSLEDYFAKRFGLSKSSVNKTYSKQIKNAVEDGILELSEDKGTLYKISGEKINSKNEKIYLVDKFEDGEVTHLKMSQDEIPLEIQKENVIFSYGDNNEIISKEDIYQELEEIIKDELEYIKGIQDKKALSFRKEGQIYDVSEKNGYIMLTNSKGRSIEDIEFLVDEYKGAGKYQIINGIYKKIKE